QGIMSAFPGADANDFFNRVHENDPVADVAGLRSLLDDLDRFLDVVIAQNDIELNARQKVHFIGSDPPGQFDASLASMPAHFHHIHPDDSDFRERLLDSDQFFLAEDGFDFLGHD